MRTALFVLASQLVLLRHRYLRNSTCQCDLMSFNVTEPGIHDLHADLTDPLLNHCHANIDINALSPVMDSRIGVLLKSNTRHSCIAMKDIINNGAWHSSWVRIDDAIKTYLWTFLIPSMIFILNIYPFWSWMSCVLTYWNDSSASKWYHRDHFPFIIMFLFVFVRLHLVRVGATSSEFLYKEMLLHCIDGYFLVLPMLRYIVHYWIQWSRGVGSMTILFKRCF